MSNIYWCLVCVLLFAFVPLVGFLFDHCQRGNFACTFAVAVCVPAGTAQWHSFSSSCVPLNRQSSLISFVGILIFEATDLPSFGARRPSPRLWLSSLVQCNYEYGYVRPGDGINETSIKANHSAIASHASAGPAPRAAEAESQSEKRTGERGQWMAYVHISFLFPWLTPSAIAYFLKL